MATPVIAGSAILVRQYFTDGYYPTGQKIAADAFTPSSALIKAVMISGVLLVCMRCAVMCWSGHVWCGGGSWEPEMHACRVAEAGNANRSTTHLDPALCVLVV